MQGGNPCEGVSVRYNESLMCRGIALGDSWISALDYVKTWGDFLKAWSLLDNYQLSQLAPLQLDIQVRISMSRKGLLLCIEVVKPVCGQFSKNLDVNLELSLLGQCYMYDDILDSWDLSV